MRHERLQNGLIAHRGVIEGTHDASHRCGMRVFGQTKQSFSATQRRIRHLVRVAAKIAEALRKSRPVVPDNHLKVRENRIGLPRARVRVEFSREIPLDPRQSCFQ
jgi:hypothetical protein